jgi:DNA invertase Pin-like site-specific DNA recombinase
MSASEPLRAVIYRRVSTYQQLGGISPETQLARAEALIAEQRWEIVGDFYDPALSGAKESRRDLDRMLEMCRAGLVDVVMVGDLSRLSRDLRNSLNFEHELQQLGVQVVDLDNPHAEEHVKQVNYWLGGWQRAQIRKVTHRGVLAVAKAGYWPGRTPAVRLEDRPGP